MAIPSRNSSFDSARNPVRTFFVSSRTSRGVAVLQTERMAMLFIDVLRSYMRAGKFKVHEFVVMPNHVHILLSVGPELSCLHWTGVHGIAGKLCAFAPGGDCRSGGSFARGI